MHFPNYPQGTVSNLLETDLVLPQTKAVLESRLQKPAVSQPKFFSPEDFKTLQAVCNRLIPQEEHEPVNLAGLLDADLAQNKGNGWRYNEMPPDQQAFCQGIAGIDAYALSLCKQPFTALPPQQQDEVLQAVQNEYATGEAWHNMPSDLFFEELLSRLSEFYYSNPLAKETIGDVSFADAHGWDKIQLNEKEPQEILPL